MKVFIFASALAIPAVAAAQATATHPVNDVRNEARGHVGPFYLTPAVHLKEVGVDSNVFNDAGEQKSDFTATVTPKLDVWVPMARRALLHTSAAPDLVWYSRYDSERSIDPQVTVRGEAYLSRVTLFGQHEYLNTRQRPNHDVDLRSRRQEDTITAGVAVGLTPKFSFEIAGRRSDLQYDTDAEFDGTSLRRTLDRGTSGLQLTARHHLTSLTSIVVRSDALRDRFPFSPGRDSDSYRVMPGVEFAPQALLKGTASVGYRKFTPATPAELPAFSGIVAELGLSYTLLGATTFGVTYRRDLTYSYSETHPFFVDNAIGASIRRALGGRFDVLVSGTRHNYDYRRSPIVLADAGERVDTTSSYAASLGYRIGREGRLGVGVSYVQRESTIQFRSYDNLRFLSTFSYGL